jgi:hypothetical protein
LPVVSLLPVASLLPVVSPPSARSPSIRFTVARVGPIPPVDGASTRVNRRV